MEHQSVRFFATNIPENVTEDDLRHAFSNHGKVKKVELKSKENLSEPHKRAKFAFITLNIDENYVSRCIEDVSRRNFKGGRLSVSRARESFLERLKREREEAAVSKKSVDEEACPPSHQNWKSNNTNDYISRNDYGEEEDEEEEEYDCPQNAYSENTYSEESKKTAVADKSEAKDELPDKAQISNLKRKEGLKKIQNTYVKQKSLIKNALSQIDKPHSKKFDFTDDSDNEEETVAEKSKQKQKQKMILFDEDEENEAFNDSEKVDDFQYKGDFQPKSNADPRFVMGSQFAEDDTKIQKVKPSDDDEVSERQMQIDIIEKVIGRKVEQKKRQHLTAANILHYDPSKKEHEQFVKTTDHDNAINEKNVKSVKEAKEKRIENAGEEVSKEIYYKVSNDFKKSFHGTGNEFSLLHSFGVAPMEVEKDSSIEKFEKTKLAQDSGKNQRDFVHHLLPEDKDEDKVPAKFEKSDTQPNSKKSQKVVTSEGLFFFKGDQRLSQGLTFFKQKSGVSEDYENIRKKLRFVIHRKIARAKKNQIQSGIKSRPSRFKSDRKKTGAT